jgi:transposase-like protein
MRAIAKINALGVPFLARRVGRSPSILYRWRKALEAGDGIRDVNKRLLIDAASDTAQPIDWADFAP